MNDKELEEKAKKSLDDATITIQNRLQQLTKEAGTTAFNPDMITIFNYMYRNLILTKTDYEHSVGITNFIQKQQAWNESSWKVITDLIEIVTKRDTESKQDMTSLNKRIDELKKKQPKFSMKLNSVELGIPSFIKAKFERTKE